MIVPKLKRLWPVLLLIPAVLSLFWPALLSPTRVLFPTFSPFSDLMVIHWPKALLMAQSWQAGQGLPLWTPLILSGMPLAANQLAMLFYPPAWLFLIWPPAPVFNLLFVFHLLLGGFGVYLLLRWAHRLSPAAALLGGVTFALNGKWLAHVAGGHVSMVGAIGWMPWALLGVMMLLDGGFDSQPRAGQSGPAPRRWSWALLAAIALAMQVVTHTLPLIYSAYLLAAAVIWYLVVMASGARLARLKRLWLPLTLIPLLAGLLGAVQLLPLLELAQYSNRSLSLAEAARFAVTPAQLLVGLLLPSEQGGHEFVIYLGLAPLLLAPLGLFRERRWTWFYGLALLFSILFALGPATPIHALFYRFVPGFGWVRTPARMFFVSALAIAVLTGFGLERLRLARWSPGGKRWLVRLAMIAGLLALLVGLGLAFGFGQMGRASLALAIVVPVGAAVILLRVQRVIPAALTAGLLGLILFVDLAWFDLSLMRFVPLAQALAPGQTAAEYLAQQGSDRPLFRVYSPSYSLPTQTAAEAGLHLADGVEPVHLAVYDRYMAKAGGYEAAGFSVTIPNFGAEPLETAFRQTEPNLKLLGLLNVGYLAAAFPMPWSGLTSESEVGETYLYRNDQAMPRAWVVHRTRPLPEMWLDQLSDLPDPARLALVDGGPQLTGPTPGPATPAQVVYYSPDRIEIETNLPESGWLIVSEIWYPGWRALDNGAEQSIVRANGLLRGVYLAEPGSHRVVMIYRPRTVVWGGWISGLGAGGLVVGLGIWAIGVFIKNRG